MTAFIDKLAWVHLVERKILSSRSRGKDTYYIPGGKREGSETDHEALIREIKEELSVDLIESSIAFLGQFEAQAHGKAVGTLVRMRCYTAEYTGDLSPAAEIEEIVWLSYKDKERSAPVDKLIFDWLAQQDLLA